MKNVRERVNADGSIAFQVRVRGFPAETLIAPAKRDRARVRAQAEIVAGELRKKKAQGQSYVAPAETLGAFLDAYEARWRIGKQPATVARRAETRKHLAPLEPRAIPQLRSADVEDLVAKVAAEHPRAAQLSLELLKAAIRSAQSRGQVIDPAILVLRAPQYESRDARFLTVEELFTLSSWLPEHIRRIVPVAGLTGMRQGELFALTDTDVELDAALLRVRRGKTKAARRQVALSGDAVTLVREQLMVRAKGSRLVFPTKTGRRQNRHGFMEKAYRPAAVAAGMGEYTLDEDGSRHYEGVTFHDLRHSFVSIAAAAGWRFEHVARHVGWSSKSAAAMFARYRHLFDEEMDAQIRRLDAFVRRDDTEEQAQ